MEPISIRRPIDPGGGDSLEAGDVLCLAEVLRVPGDGTEDPTWEMRTRDQRLAAVRALGATGHPDAIVPLCGALSDLSFPVRQAAAEALVALADQCPVPELRRAVPILRMRSAHCRSELPAVQRKCRLALERIEAVTAPFKDLPVPVVAAAGRTDTLPRVGSSPEIAAPSLPLVASPDRVPVTPGAPRTVSRALRLLVCFWPGMPG